MLQMHNNSCNYLLAECAKTARKVYRRARIRGATRRAISQEKLVFASDRLGRALRLERQPGSTRRTRIRMRVDTRRSALRRTMRKAGALGSGFRLRPWGKGRMISESACDAVRQPVRGCQNRTA